MLRTAFGASALVGLALPLAVALPAAATVPVSAPPLNQQAVATFVPGQTDGLSPVSGSETFSQVGTGTISVAGSVAGLRPNTVYVTVPYFDGGCTPLPGVTAFPSSSFTTDGLGRSTFSATVNPKAVNPTGAFTVSQTRSVSVRQVLVNGVQVPMLPIGSPTVPNVGAVEACDTHPAVTNQ